MQFWRYSDRSFLLTIAKRPSLDNPYLISPAAAVASYLTRDGRPIRELMGVRGAGVGTMGASRTLGSIRCPGRLQKQVVRFFLGWPIRDVPAATLLGTGICYKLRFILYYTSLFILIRAPSSSGKDRRHSGRWIMHYQPVISLAQLEFNAVLQSKAHRIWTQTGFGRGFLSRVPGQAHTIQSPNCAF